MPRTQPKFQITTFGPIARTTCWSEKEEADARETFAEMDDRNVPAILHYVEQVGGPIGCCYRLTILGTTSALFPPEFD